MKFSETILVRATVAAVFWGATLTNALMAAPTSSVRGIGPVPRNIPLRIHTNIDATVLRSTQGDDNVEESNDNASDETIRNGDDKEEEEESSEVSLLDKVNNFLDTPILDANNRSDQGAVAETLKEFVRDEPEIAQVTFSVVVVAFLALATRAFMSL